MILKLFDNPTGQISIQRPSLGYLFLLLNFWVNDTGTGALSKLKNPLFSAYMRHIYSLHAEKLGGVTSLVQFNLIS